MTNSLHILIADDDEDDVMFFREALFALKVSNYNMATVNNGVQALDYLLKRGHYANLPAPAPDFVVLDLNMPILDGFAVLQEIREMKEYKDLPVFILTTSNVPEHIDRCTRLGCSGFFTKPPKLKEMTAVIGDMLGKAAPPENKKVR